MPASAGCVAAYTDVAAPSWMLLKKTGAMRAIPPLKRRGGLRCRLVMITPGCTAFAVCPGGSRLRQCLGEHQVGDFRLAVEHPGR